VPWKDIATSVPFWALMVTHTLNNFGWYMLLVELPSFMSAGLGFNIKEVSAHEIYKHIKKREFSQGSCIILVNDVPIYIYV
jgi:ACS family sodium-dependent inorganic phosphate cotransporter